VGLQPQDLRGFGVGNLVWPRENEPPFLTAGWERTWVGDQQIPLFGESALAFLGGFCGAVRVQMSDFRFLAAGVTSRTMPRPKEMKRTVPGATAAFQSALFWCPVLAGLEGEAMSAEKKSRNWTNPPLELFELFGLGQTRSSLGLRG